MSYRDILKEEPRHWEAIFTMEGSFEEWRYLAKHLRSGFSCQKLQAGLLDGVKLSSSFSVILWFYKAEGTVDSICDI